MIIVLTTDAVDVRGCLRSTCGLVGRPVVPSRWIPGESVPAARRPSLEPAGPFIPGVSRSNEPINIKQTRRQASSKEARGMQVRSGMANSGMAGQQGGPKRNCFRGDAFFATVKQQPCRHWCIGPGSTLGSEKRTAYHTVRRRTANGAETANSRQPTWPRRRHAFALLAKGRWLR